MIDDAIGAGAKHDSGKRRWELLPWDAVAAAVDVLGFGAAKYGAYSWRRVPHGRERYFAACVRHLHAWWGGEDTDPESGLPHLAHALCCVVFLLSLDADEDASDYQEALDVERKARAAGETPQPMPVPRHAMIPFKTTPEQKLRLAEIVVAMQNARLDRALIVAAWDLCNHVNFM